MLLMWTKTKTKQTKIKIAKTNLRGQVSEEDTESQDITTDMLLMRTKTKTKQKSKLPR